MHNVMKFLDYDAFNSLRCVCYALKGLEDQTTYSHFEPSCVIRESSLVNCPFLECVTRLQINHDALPPFFRVNVISLHADVINLMFLPHSLTRLNLSFRRTSLDGIQELKQLRVLNLSRCPDAKDVSFLPISIEILSLRGTSLEHPSFLSRLINLKAVDMRDQASSTIKHLSALPRLKYMNIGFDCGRNRNETLDNILVLPGFNSIERLEIDYYFLSFNDRRWSVERVGFSNLHTLCFFGCDHMQLWSFLKSYSHKISHLIPPNVFRFDAYYEFAWCLESSFLI